MNAPIVIVRKLADAAAYITDHEKRITTVEQREFRRVAFASGVGAAIGTLFTFAVGAATICAIFL